MLARDQHSSLLRKSVTAVKSFIVQAQVGDRALLIEMNRNLSESIVKTQVAQDLGFLSRRGVERILRGEETLKDVLERRQRRQQRQVSMLHNFSAAGGIFVGISVGEVC